MIVQRHNIGLFGKVNAGKSTLMNLITQQECSIVDSKPGTTADIKSAPMEIHGLGPINLFDTAGIDEEGELGDKKRAKALNCLQECDLALLVIDSRSEDLRWEKVIIDKAKEMGKQLLVIFNIFGKENTIRLEYPSTMLDATNPSSRQPLLNFIIENFRPIDKSLELMPFIEKGQFYVLNIPMDDETPKGRLLRPQQMVEEYITRNWAYPVAYRMDLAKARAGDIEEKNRFDGFIKKIRPKAIITDSQAMDVMVKWVPEDILLTTLSIVMINYSSKGMLAVFVQGIKALETLKKGHKVLIAEACNHSRIAEDIGTVQIPKYLEKHYPGIIIDHSLGREFIDVAQYHLVIHCGGCMIDSQKLASRLFELKKAGIPITNYGIFLARLQGKDALDKVLKPWGITA